MSEYAPVELIDQATGKRRELWVFSRSDPSNSVPIGYCAEDCPGHPTANGAREHFKQYLLDKYAQYDRRLTEQQRPCEICGVLTDRFAEMPSKIADLCDNHCNRENFEHLIEPVANFLAAPDYLQFTSQLYSFRQL